MSLLCSGKEKKVDDGGNRRIPHKKLRETYIN